VCVCVVFSLLHCGPQRCPHPESRRGTQPPADDIQFIHKHRHNRKKDGVSCKKPPSRAWKKRKSCLFPKTKIPILMTMVVLWCSHSAAGRARLRWHRTLRMGTRSGPASRGITGFLRRRRRRRRKRRRRRRESLPPVLARRATVRSYSVLSSPSQDNALYVLAVFFVPKLSFIVSVGASAEKVSFLIFKRRSQCRVDHILISHCF